MALEQVYQQYRKHTEFFIIYLAEQREPNGFWINVSDAADLHARAERAHNCPLSKGLTTPRLLDNAEGVGDYLYRADPARLVIVDINGRIAYESPDTNAGVRTDLDQVIAHELAPLAANGGALTPQTLAKARSDEAGKPAVGFWLPRVEYFATAAWHFSQHGKATMVSIKDARGKTIPVPAVMRDALLHKRALVARLFTPDMTLQHGAMRPVVLIFGNEHTLPAGAATAGVEQFFRTQQASADCYLVYTPMKPGTAFAVAAQAAKTWLHAGKLTMPCLVDSPEREVSYAYAATPGRLIVVALDANHQWVVRYASPAGATGVAHGLLESERILQK